MEEWFHDSNKKVEVINAQPLIAKVLQSLQQFFPKKYKHEWIQSSKNARNYQNARVYEAIWKWN